jgi:hypothetical protein
MIRTLARRGVSLLVLAALWLPALEGVLHGALSPHQWVRHMESSDGCHAERCLLGMALAERAEVAPRAEPPAPRQASESTEVPRLHQAPLPVRPQTSGLPRSPPR